jgi:predicted XRE-type DNA-binding protein
MSESDRALARLLRALQRVRDAEERATTARRQLREMMQAEIDAGRVNQTEIARAFGVSRQRIRQMLNELD